MKNLDASFTQEDAIRNRKLSRQAFRDRRASVKRRSRGYAAYLLRTSIQPADLPEDAFQSRHIKTCHDITENDNLTDDAAVP